LGICYQAVEVCSGDMPTKHYRQIDYEAWFPGENKFREICSNGNASDFQNRGLNIFYLDENGEKQTPWGLNCTAITFRTGLAILEQNQTKEGKVKLPEVLQSSFGAEFLE
jgi:seryl-tRNA synthetase